MAIVVFSISAPWFLRAIVVRERCRAAHPGGLSFQILVRTLRSPEKREAERRNSRVRKRRTRWPALRQGLSRLRTGLPAHDADRRAFRRPTAAISLSPDRLLETEGAFLGL